MGLLQVLPVVQESFVGESRNLHKSSLYGATGKLLKAVESSDKPELKKMAETFWAEIEETANSKLTSSEGLSEGDNFEEKIVTLVKCLFYPKIDSKQKSSKVMFETSSDLNIAEKVSKLTLLEPSSAKIVPEKICLDFVHRVTLKAFLEAHKSTSTTHLRIFAQLLEINSDEEIVSKVITSCHGDTETETTSHYFVFNICVPWLQKVQHREGFLENFSHLVRMTCIFLSVLDSESILQLLDKLFEVVPLPLFFYAPISNDLGIL